MQAARASSRVVRRAVVAAPAALRWTRTPAACVRARVATAAAPRARVAVAFTPSRFFGSGGALTEQDVTARVIETLKSLEKIDESIKVTADSHFLNDLGLDSLDAVEAIMALEDEFSIEITDEEMEKIQTAKEAIQLILHHPQAK